MLSPTQDSDRVDHRHPSSGLADHELIDALNRGDSEAFDHLYERHRDWVLKLAHRFTRNHQTSLDVLQETFLYFVRKFPGFILTCKLRTFLYPVVRNLSLTAVRKSSRYVEGEMALEEAEAQPAMVAKEESGDTGDLEHLLAGLSDVHREIVLLRFVEGFDLKEIALAMEIPVGTVKSRLHHAVNHLRQSPRTRRFFNQTDSA